jgi:hypothetical protein
MERTPTLNETKGRQLSNLEALLILTDKMLCKKLEEKPKAGVTLCKGQPNERKLSYREAQGYLQALRDYFGALGCFSLGVCETCTRYTPDPSGSPFGSCRTGGNMVHKWHSCDRHSKEGGGYGL